MISHISGVIKNIEPQIITIENSGFCFLVSVPRESVYTVNQEVNLNIHFYWNQETGPQFFGFQSKLDKDMFIMLINCSGIGCKLSLSILSQIDTITFINAISSQDRQILSSISGLGAKKIDMLILQLKSKIDKIILNNSYDINNLKHCQSNFLKFKEVCAVLTSLNYSKQEISGALDLIKVDANLDSFTFDQILKKTLSHLVKKY